MEDSNAKLGFQHHSNRPQAEISGEVLDSLTNEPIIGATIKVKGGSEGTVTDADGKFNLDVPEDAILQVSSIGYLTKDIPVNNRSNITIQLSSSSTALKQLVVVGYGTQKKADVIGAVSQVSSDELEGRPVTNLSTALQGTAPNLIIQQSNFEPGQGVNINIRGIGTLGDNTPLFVIDGVVGADINLINPNDIESVTVLKDAGSAAIYGSRAANGVLLVTTKKGEKGNRPHITYNAVIGTQHPRVPFKPVHAWENAYYKNVSLVNSGLPPSFTPEQIRTLAEKGDGDWSVNGLLKDALQQNHTLSISGGGDNNTYMLSLGYLDQDKNFVGPNYGYKRYNVRLNYSVDVGRLKLNTIVGYAKVHNKDHSYNTGTLMADAGRVPLYYSFKDSTGNFLTNSVSAEQNPLAILEQGGYRQSDDDEISGNLNAEIKIIDGLKVKGLVSGTVRSNTSFSRVINLQFTPGGSYGNDRPVSNNNYKALFSNLQLMAEYEKDLGSGNLDVLVGASNESTDERSNQITQTLVDPLLGVPTTGTIIDPDNSFNSIQGTTERSLNSIFGRAKYLYDNKYIAEFDFRYDGSSVFPKNKRWGFFPSISLGWRMTEESFMEGVKDKIGDIKIRGSYGILGNQNVSAYQYQTTFFNYTNAYAFDKDPVGGAGFMLGNPDLTWERATTFNVGADVALLENKIQLSFDYFDKTTSDILYPRSDVPEIFGAGFPSYNVAKVRDQGWEFQLNYNAVTGNFKHNVSFNIADNLNKLLALSSGATQELNQVEEYQLLRRIGQPITTYYGYKTNGFFQNLDDLNNYPQFANGTVSPGDLKFVDRNQDGVINDQDKFILGNPFPRYTFGLNYSLVFKDFDLNILIQGVGKRSQMIRGEQVEPFHVGYSGVIYTHQTDFWTPTNPNAKYPRLAESGSASNTNNYRTGSDLLLFNAAYGRLKNLEVGYSLPKTWLQSVGIQSLRVYFSAQNIVTLSKLNFLDPENTEFNNNLGMGSGANSARAYFLPEFFGGGINVVF